jgi:hypothetical protein
VGGFFEAQPGAAKFILVQHRDDRGSNAARSPATRSRATRPSAEAVIRPKVGVSPPRKLQATQLKAL